MYLQILYIQMRIGYWLCLLYAAAFNFPILWKSFLEINKYYFKIRVKIFYNLYDVVLFWVLFKYMEFSAEKWGDYL